MQDSPVISCPKTYWQVSLYSLLSHVPHEMFSIFVLLCSYLSTSASPTPLVPPFLQVIIVLELCYQLISNGKQCEFFMGSCAIKKKAQHFSCHLKPSWLCPPLFLVLEITYASFHVRETKDKSLPEFYSPESTTYLSCLSDSLIVTIIVLNNKFIFLCFYSSSLK
jgi:hypothetical protein